MRKVIFGEKTYKRLTEIIQEDLSSAYDDAYGMLDSQTYMERYRGFLEKMEEIAKMSNLQILDEDARSGKFVLGNGTMTIKIRTKDDFHGDIAMYIDSMSCNYQPNDMNKAGNDMQTVQKILPMLGYDQAEEVQ